jgi:hypothetical protein
LFSSLPISGSYRKSTGDPPTLSQAAGARSQIRMAAMPDRPLPKPMLANVLDHYSETVGLTLLGLQARNPPVFSFSSGVS